MHMLLILSMYDLREHLLHTYAAWPRRTELSLSLSFFLLSREIFSKPGKFRNNFLVKQLSFVTAAAASASEKWEEFELSAKSVVRIESFYEIKACASSSSSSIATSCDMSGAGVAIAAWQCKNPEEISFFFHS